MSDKELLLAQPRGFCAGVDRAIEIVERALQFGAPIYVRHEIVHNAYVVADLRAKGASSSKLSEVPAGQTLVFSAHGVSRRCAPRPMRAASASLTPLARWSPRCTWKWPRCASRAARSS
jgi:4-hydroxy-3-methylbut-2-enyl diphosphate reductase IspH